LQGIVEERLVADYLRVREAEWSRVGGSAAFRKFIRTDLMPRARERYRTTGATAVVGESPLADVTRRLAIVREEGAFPGLARQHESLPDEKHSNIHHPAALRAFRVVFKPGAGK
jgi:hypothetical protein